MIIPPRARWKLATNMAYESMLDFNLKNLPIDIFKFAEYHDIEILTYSFLSKHSKIFGFVNSKFHLSKLPKDGFALMLDGVPYIFYNDNEKTAGRVRFTIAHELGHILVGHFYDFDLEVACRDIVTSAEYRVLETEANIFARNILAPYPLLTNFELLNEKIVSKFFNITEKAAKARVDLIEKDIYNVSKQLINKFIAKFKHLVEYPRHLKVCANCHHHFALENSQVCYICGSHQISKDATLLGGIELKYPGVSTDENRKATFCPNCLNDEIHTDGEYCSQCGVNLINKCSNFNETHSGRYYLCEEKLPGNARYCHVCGSPSTFLQDRLLTDWQITLNDIHRDNIEHVEFATWEANKIIRGGKI